MDRLVYSFFIIFVFLLLTGSAQALVLTQHISNATFVPGESKDIGYITVLNENNQTDVVADSYSIFLTELSPNSFALANGGIQNVSIIVTIPPYYQPTSYSLPIVFVSNDGLQQTAIPIEIIEHLNYSLSSTAFSFNLTMGEEIIQPITIENLGNTNLLISAYNTSPFLAPRPNLTIYKRESFDFKTVVSPPKNSSEGFYQENMTLDVNGQKNNITFSFWLKDDEKPNITNTSFAEKINFSEAQIINFTVTDNVGIKSVTATIENPDGEEIEQEIIGNYTIEFTQTDLIGEYTLIINAEDLSGNKVSVPVIFEVIPVKALYLESNVDFGKVKAQETYYPKNIGYLSETATLYFKISDVEILNNTEIMINENPINGKNTQIKGLHGNLKMEIMSADTGEYDFYFTVTGEESIETEEDNVVNIHIEFLDYQPLGDFNDSWLGYNVTCEAKDTGILATSSYDCVMSFPAMDKYGRLMDFGTLTLPTSPEWKDEWVSEWQGKVDRLSITVAQQTFFMWMFFIIMVILGVAFWYLEWFLPRYSAT